MKRQTVFNLVVVLSLMLTSAVSLISIPAALAAPTPPGPDTVLFDHFDNATLAQYASGTMSYVDGPSGFGKAADFTGGNWLRYNVPGWYQWPTTYDPTGKQGTVELWVYPNRYNVGLLEFNWNNSASYPSAGHILHLQIDSAGKLTAGTWSAIYGPGYTLTPLPTGNTTIPLNQWTHVAFTWGSAGTRLYVNGALDASTPDNLYPALNSTFYVYVPYWGIPGLGYIDELHILKTQVDYNPMISTVNLTGPTAGLMNTTYVFTATVSPITATLPITYTWQATGQTPVTHTRSVAYIDAVSLTWSTVGVKTITVTASNADGLVTATVQFTPTAPPPSMTSPAEDLALGKSSAGSSVGWGGGSYPQDLFDGIRYYTDTWMHGIAWTGGPSGWAGEACGWRYVVVNFDALTTFNRVLVWYFREQDTPVIYKIQIWDGQDWQDVFSTTQGRQYRLYPNAEPTDWWVSSIPYQNTFAPATASKVRLAVDNCAVAEHGWVWEMEVYNDAPEETSLTVEPAPGEIYPGDPISVALNIQNANNLYAAQSTCAVNPAILQPHVGIFGNFFDLVNRLVGANVISPTLGTWTGAISQRSPALPLSGDGLFATVTYTASNPGVTAITCDPLFSDRDGFTQTVSFSGANITVLPFGAISGTVKYQGRLNHAAITVSATGMVTFTQLTNAAGAVAFDQLKTGSYQLKADASLYLPRCTDNIAVTSGQTATLTATTLLGGDVNDDDVINIGDATRIGAEFGSADPGADINADEVVNVQDLAILGGNYEVSGCQPW